MIIIKQKKGAFHFSDTQYVFGLPMMELNPEVRNQSGFYTLHDYSDQDVAFSDFFMTLIANFARTGYSLVYIIIAMVNSLVYVLITMLAQGII